MKKAMGLSLIELLVVLSILGILVSAIPSFSGTIERTRQETTFKTLYQLSQYVRALAIDNNKVITLCGSIDNSNCTKNWKNATALIFDDKNRNKKCDKNDILYRSMTLANKTIAWRGSNRAYMRYHPQGYLMDWGSYTICPQIKGGDAIKLILNRMGRGYKDTISANDINLKNLCPS